MVQQMITIPSSVGDRVAVGIRSLKRNAELYEKYKDNFDDRIRLGIFPPVRTCFRKACGLVYDADSIEHIYCTPECQRLNDVEKYPHKHAQIQDDISSHNEVLLTPLPVLIEEGCNTCANCSSKLPRQHEDWWTLKNGDWYCIRCIGRK